MTIFAEIIALLPEAKYTIIGPDGGEGPALRRTCVELGIEGAVRFAGPMDFSQIAREASLHSFYLCTSILEGMAMSVVEAMQLGLVPIVTAVGEIANYCEDGKNSLVIDDDASVASRVARLIGNRELYYELRRNAVNYWSSRPLYRDDVIAACRALAPRKQ